MRAKIAQPTAKTLVTQLELVGLRGKLVGVSVRILCSSKSQGQVNDNIQIDQTTSEEARAQAAEQRIMVLTESCFLISMIWA